MQLGVYGEVMGLLLFSVFAVKGDIEWVKGGKQIIGTISYVKFEAVTRQSQPYSDRYNKRKRTSNVVPYL